ncbi:MAG: HAD-IG family 5'-nucleotidase [Thermoanaerobaculales bacterium]|nr:HAD-IG family 5'-nucleotidase [Thermoanaerobaculales bacterium]
MADTLCTMMESTLGLEQVPPGRQIYSNRTLNLRTIRAIGYDMDYTLVHYRADVWEQRVYDRLKELFVADGWPIQDLRFDPSLVIRGLVIDTELGNIVKANRFGYVMRAAHGTRRMTFEDQRDVYRHTPVDLSEPRFVFLNTLFSLSASCFYAQLVDLYDEHVLTEVHGYQDLFRQVTARLDMTHIEGSLKADIMADPEPYIVVDPQAPQALLDQLQAGKRLMLISNSEWNYAQRIMSYAYDRYLPPDRTWRDLFELVIVGARKPGFFSYNLPIFSIADEEAGLLKPVAGPIPGPGAYLGGDATKVEEYLGLSGASILYVGDHIFADVKMSKSSLRWRTALILRELEEELAAVEGFRDAEKQLAAMMVEKVKLEKAHSRARLALQRLHQGYGEQPEVSKKELEGEIASLRSQTLELDERITPLAREAAELENPSWGALLRAGNDKSHLARQIEGSADVYTSRVSNFLYATPFAYLRSRRGSMPHDPLS